MAELTNKQARFVEEYLVDLNATQAAIRAGYSKKGATVRGSELLANRKVKRAVAVKRREQAKRTEITADMILEGLLHEARNAESDAARVSAWSWLGKHRALWTDRVEVTEREPVQVIRTSKNGR